MRNQSLVAAPVALAVALLTASCSSQQDAPAAAASAVPTQAATPSPAATPSTATPSPAATPTLAPVDAGATIRISSFEYEVPASVPAGSQVTVVNEDREAHTVTVDRGRVRLSVLPGATAVFTAPTDAGPHPVVCDFHGGMDAELVVA